MLDPPQMRARTKEAGHQGRLGHFGIPGRQLVCATPRFRGRGLHRGQWAEMTIRPALAGTGLIFVSQGATAIGRVPASLTAAREGLDRRTALAQKEWGVETVEHVLSALWGLGIYDAEVVLAGPEPPAGDGSARAIAQALWRCSRPCAPFWRPWTVVRPFSLQRGSSGCWLAPHRRLSLHCTVDFSHPLIGRQVVQTTGWDPAWYLRRVAPARTFGLVKEHAILRGRGLARGAHLGNTLAFTDKGLANLGGTRFVDEPVRHKLLDALGDLALLQGPLRGAVTLRRCSHQLLLSTLRGAVHQGALVRGEPT